jgi:N-acetyl-anhydromuramyl-L-alanine amidase AmpD
MNKVANLYKEFKDNSYPRFKRIVLHWTASGTAESAINWLNQRLQGKGTVVYNYIIDRDGTVFELVDPFTRWAYHTGLGAPYDSQSIGIALVSWGVQDQERSGSGWVFFKNRYLQNYTSEQKESLKALLDTLHDSGLPTDEMELTHHAAINPHKPDMPESMFNELVFDLGIDDLKKQKGVK